MRFRIEQRFAGTVEEVAAAFVDPAFLERLRDLPKLGAPTLLDQQATEFTVNQRVAYRFTGDVSAAVRRVVDPARLTWVEESTLDRASAVTTWRILADHYPAMIRCSGTFTLLRSGDRTTRRVADGEIKVNIPLVGGRVERAIVSGLEDHAGLEEQVLDAWLAERRA